MFLTNGFIFYSGYGTQNVGDWVERAEESRVKEVTLTSFQSLKAAAAGEQKHQHKKFGQHGLDRVSFALAFHISVYAVIL